MLEAIATTTLVLAAITALFSLIGLAVLLQNRRTGAPATATAMADLLRTESDRQRQVVDEQARVLRQELGGNIRGFQETTLRAFTELGHGLGERITGFGARLDTGVKAIDDRVAQIGSKVDADLQHMGEEADKNRDALRQAIEGKLDEAAGKQAAASRELREEVTGSVQRLQESLTSAAQEQRKEQAERFDSFAQRLSQSLGEMNQRNDAMKELQTRSLVDLAEISSKRHETMVAALDTKLKDMFEAQAKAGGEMRAELGRAQEGLRQIVEGRLDAIRVENTAKLDEIRKTVDEQLQTTLTERVASSFKMVHDQLEQVHRGLGEMQQLAGDVGDLKRVLANVKTRGIFGEVLLGSLMEQVFSPEQYIENAQVCPGSQERVEFALKVPGRSGEGDVLLPIDAKFPTDDYKRVVEAGEKADAVAVEAASLALETRLKGAAKDIRDKYINPPHTTDFAILFLPTEGLHAEVLRRPGLIETIQQMHVVIAGPTTLMAILCAFRMSLRAVAIQKRSTEVWRLLGAVQAEFTKHGDVVAKLQRQLQASLTTVDQLGTRTRQMNRKLQGVETIGADKIEEVLGLPPLAEESEAVLAEDADAQAAL